MAPDESLVFFNLCFETNIFKEKLDRGFEPKDCNVTQDRTRLKSLSSMLVIEKIVLILHISPLSSFDLLYWIIFIYPPSIKIWGGIITYLSYFIEYYWNYKQIGGTSFFILKLPSKFYLELLRDFFFKMASPLFCFKNSFFPFV